MPYAVITGASYGIGEAMAKLMAEKGHHLILIARSGDKLRSLAHELNTVQTEVIVTDLSKANAAQKVYQTIKDRKLQVDCLVNNAGFGESKEFINTSSEQVVAMMQLNVATLTNLTKLFLTDFKQQGGGRILNVGSVASFVPGPNMAIYHATKAFVLSFSESLHEELKPHGIYVSALCPGPTETRKNKLNKSSNKKAGLLQSAVMMTPAQVARKGYHGMMRNKPVIIPGLLNKGFIWLMGWLPRWPVRKIMVAMLKKI